jgi:hypothetical protein
VATHGVTAWLRQEDARALSFGRAWSRAASAGALGGRVAVTHTDGARFAWTAPAEAQRLALVAPVGPHRGWLTIRQGRYQLGTIDLYAPRAATRTIELLPRTNRKHPLVVYAHVRGRRSSVAIDAVLATSDRR